MNVENRRVIAVFAAVLTLLASSGCAFGRPQASVGQLQTRSQSVALAGAAAERVEIEMGAGELAVSGGASELMQAKFTYNVAELNPQVTRSPGTLSVRTPAALPGISSLRDLPNLRYVWDLQLNDTVPMQLKVSMGAGTSNLRLGSLSLTNLELETGAGSVTVDLTGNPRNDLDAKISGGVGELTLRLPRSACPRVSVEKGLGKVDAQGLAQDGNNYVSDACGKAARTLRIAVTAGVGSVKLEMGG